MGKRVQKAIEKIRNIKPWLEHNKIFLDCFYTVFGGLGMFIVACVAAWLAYGQKEAQIAANQPRILVIEENFPYEDTQINSTKIEVYNVDNIIESPFVKVYTFLDIEAYRINEPSKGKIHINVPLVGYFNISFPTQNYKDVIYTTYNLKNADFVYKFELENRINPNPLYSPIFLKIETFVKVDYEDFRGKNSTQYFRSSSVGGSRKIEVTSNFEKKIKSHENHMNWIDFSTLTFDKIYELIEQADSEAI